MRHGIAVDREDPDSPPDPDRNLNEKGKRRTRLAARGLKSIDVNPTVIMTSPWARARETAEIVAETLHVEEIRESELLLPDADPAALFAELQGLDVDELMVIGHAPHVDELVTYFLHPDSNERRLVTRLKKAGVACVDINGETTLRWVLDPQTLRTLSRLSRKK